MKKIAITGNIAAGKTTVQNFIEQKGYKVFDTDKSGHGLLNTMPEIKQNFSDCLDNYGKIDREKLGHMVFADPDLRAELESIIHPAIKKEILKFFEQNKSENLVFVGIPLLFETHMRDIFDKAVLIYADDEIREKRLLMRNNYTAEYARVRMNAQQSQDRKKSLCDYVIMNNGSISDLKFNVEKILTCLSMH